MQFLWNFILKKKFDSKRKLKFQSIFPHHHRVSIELDSPTLNIKWKWEKIEPFSKVSEIINNRPNKEIWTNICLKKTYIWYAISRILIDYFWKWFKWFMNPSAQDHRSTFFQPKIWWFFGYTRSNLWSRSVERVEKKKNRSTKE